MLKSTYGSLIIRKDTILYHATDEGFSYNPKKETIIHNFSPIGMDCI